MHGKALIVVDVQKGEVASLESSSSLLENINAVIKTARDKNILVLFSKHLNSLAEKQKFSVLRTERGTVGCELADGLDRKAGDEVFEKEGYSIFSNPDVDMYLKQQGIQKIYLVGLSTHVCVLLSSADAFAKGYEVVAIKEAVTANSPQKHQMGLWWMEKYSASLISMSDFIKSS